MKTRKQLAEALNKVNNTNDIKVVKQEVAAKATIKGGR